MGKYEPLGRFLKSRGADEAPMRFDEIEAVIGFPLPPAAGRHPAWWSNNASNNVMTKVWLEAGFRTERVDLGGRKVVVRRALASAPGWTSPSGASNAGVIEALRRRLGGSVRLASDYEPGEPAGATWDAEG